VGLRPTDTLEQWILADWFLRINPTSNAACNVICVTTIAFCCTASSKGHAVTVMVCWPKLYYYTVFEIWKMEFITGNDLILRESFWFMHSDMVARQTSVTHSSLHRCCCQQQIVFLSSHLFPLLWSEKILTVAWGQFLLWLPRFLMYLPLLLLLQMFSILICNFTKSWLSSHFLFNTMLPDSDA